MAQAAQIPRLNLIDCRRGASEGADAVPGLIALRRSIKSHMIGGVSEGSPHGDAGRSTNRAR
jgi:hypothetical protein